MKSTDLKHIKDIVDKYGRDLSDFDLSNKIFTKYDFTGVILPKNNDLFLNVIDKNLSGSSFSNIDMSIYSLDGVIISGVDFRENVMLSSDYNLFQNIKDKDLSYVSLPDLDYSKYNFDGVTLIGTKFYEGGILNKDKDFFQRIKNRNLNFTALPRGDYSNYNFEGVSMFYTKFGEKSLMPKDYELFKKIAMLKESSLLDSCSEDIHLYDLGNIPYNLKISGVDESQSFLIYKRYIEHNKNSKVRISTVLY